MKNFKKQCSILFQKTLLILSLLFSIHSFSQKTYIINYANNGLPTTPCPVFQVTPQLTVSGYQHYTASGGVKATTNSLTMPSSFSTFGSAYAIKFPFKVGYTYSVSISASVTSSYPLPSPTLYASWTNSLGDPNATRALDCNIVPSSAYSYWQQNIIGFNYVTASTPTSYPLGSSIVPSSSAPTYLVILATGGSNNGDVTTSIYSVTIIENIALNATSSASSIDCGLTTPITFTVNNPNSAAGITGYNWNLGPTPNGWKLPNGTVAPATYSTTTNNLTLTPVCGSGLKSISATATANGNTYGPTNSVSTSITPPSSLAINGVSNFCSGSSPYSIAGLPCTATIAWTAPPSSVATLSSLSTSPTTMTYAGTSGSFTLTANVSACATTYPVTLPMHVGANTNSDYTLSHGGMMSWCPNTSYTFGLSSNTNPPASISNIIWTVPTGWTTIYTGASFIQIKSPTGTSPSSGTLSVSFTEPCGTTLTKSSYLVYSSSACTGKRIVFTITPNPAASSITIRNIANELSAKEGQVQIIDVSGNIKKSQLWNLANKQISIPIASLQNGRYLAKIYDGVEWYSYQFIIQHH